MDREPAQRVPPVGYRRTHGYSPATVFEAMRLLGLLNYWKVFCVGKKKKKSLPRFTLLLHTLNNPRGHFRALKTTWLEFIHDKEEKGGECATFRKRNR
jgi:hypothetical protein